ncbi:MAG: eL32 family ribosomal protein [Candidatus Aenigmatarchaeota archaeon]
MTRRRKFLRQNWFKYPRLGTKWRRPRGKQSKQRKSVKGNDNIPSIGFSKDRRFRYLIRGYRTVLVNSVRDIGNVSQGFAVIIGTGVGKKKALELEGKANECGLKILNSRKIDSAKKLSKKIDEQRKIRAVVEKKLETKTEQVEKKADSVGENKKSE